MILQTKLLKEALQRVAPVAPRSAIVPILEHVWIETDGTRKVKIKLSNMAETIETTFETSEANKKEIILPYYSDFFSYVKLINEVEIELKQSEGSVEIKAGKAKSRINGEDSEAYISIPEIDAKPVKLQTEYLHIMKEKMLPFASTDDLRPAMCGVNLRVKNKRIIIEATNSNQLARMESDTDMKDIQILLRRNVPEIATGLFEGEEAELYVDGTSVKLADGISILTSRLVDERYPDTDSILPAKESEVCRADKKLLLQELQKAKLFVNEQGKMIKVKFTPKNLEITANDLDFDKSYENKMEVEGCKELLIGLDVDQMIKAAQKVEGEEVVIHHYNDPTKAIKIEEGEYLILTMPMVTN